MEDSEHLTHLLDLIAKGRIQTKEAAARLGVSERTLNRTMKARGIARPPSIKRRQRAKAAENRARRADNAQLVVERKVKVAVAAKRAGCSERTIYRYKKKIESERAYGTSLQQREADAAQPAES